MMYNIVGKFVIRYIRGKCGFMNGFREISPCDIKENLFRAVGEDWMLVTAEKKDGSVNTMTASWGGFGVMWGRPVCVCVIRPQRYTLEFVNEAERLTLSFLEDGHREALNICGKKSGRDCDKITEAGLDVVKDGDIAGFAQARMVVAGKKIYVDRIKEDCFLDRSIIDSKYPKRDYHIVFVCEIEKVFVK